ncbi:MULTISPECIES: CatA-like O-acetyltransferase [unclassified Azospirillum]|uniref:CatA-like O-acetyltransferase n=1 Tax=unclassified Azospirillum TaxID=2630922 RepID=UPI000B683803|nr:MULTISPECIES: CatA-like O-acetyltransferase [unclassified Azospirillum]SNR89659.1 chloramphenicol O-acetyltransferase type A [Azospirillum sp. RU38E]SNS05784.1 chloramphenicol O-acetyltransferase type A [Azospirillum sp. RU37A]
MPPLTDRSRQIALFHRYDQPAVNITAEAECADYTIAAKQAGIPPFALMLHAIGRASLEIENFRLRLLDGVVNRVEVLTLGYTVLGPGDNLNFSSVAYQADRMGFVQDYLADRALARAATELRMLPMTHRDYLFTTCMPWLRFTAIQHPMARFGDCSIPNIAVGRFDRTGGRLRFPLAVQAHHGLVDGIHIHRFITRVQDILGEIADNPGLLTPRA